MKEIQIPSLDGTVIDALAAYPQSGRGEGLILVRGLFASDEEVQSLADHYASLGFVTFSPNLFHRQREDSSALPAQEPNWDEAGRLYKNFDVEAGVRDLLSMLGFLRHLPACGGHVGVVGYCLGCRMAYLLAARSDLDCAVGYYGVGMETLLDEMYDVRCSFLLHLAENDKLLPPSSRDRIMRSASKNKKVTTHVYPGAGHNFAQTGGLTYHAEQATIANSRTDAFLKEHLLP